MSARPSSHPRKRIAAPARLHLLFLLAASAVARAETPPELEIANSPAPVTVSRVEIWSFEDALQRALAENPQAKVAIEEMLRARALIEQTRSQSFPTLTGNGSYSLVDGDRRIGGTVVLAQNEWNLNFMLTVPLVLPQKWAEWAHAGDQAEIQKLSVADVRRQLAISVGHTYLTVVAQRALIVQQEIASQNAVAHAKFALERMKGGYGNRIDYVRAAQEVQADQVLIEQLYASLTKFREALGVLLAVDYQIDSVGSVNLGVAPELDDAEASSENRADVRVLKYKLVATRHARRDDYTDYLPTLIGSFEPFYQNPPTIDYPRTGWQLGLALSLPIYEGGLRYGQEKERKNLEYEARDNLENGERQARSDVRTAFDSLNRAERALADARSAANLAKQALDLSTISYEAGASTNIEVIDAQRVSRDADSAVVLAENAQRQALFDLLVASGRLP
jgi:outer membrane protein TolC